jgi:hypothetical protein
MILNSPIIGAGGGATIKSIQSGNFLIPALSFSGTDTITEVDLTKSFLIYSMASDETADDRWEGWFCKATFLNSTTIKFERYDDNMDTNVSWFVIEFESGVKTQRFSVSGTGSVDQTITEVDLTKSFLLVSNKLETSDADPKNSVARAYFVNSTTVKVELGYASATLNGYIQVVEFE